MKLSDRNATSLMMVRPGLSEQEGTLSLRSADSRYIRHYERLLLLDKPSKKPTKEASSLTSNTEQDDLFNADATFILHEDHFFTGFVSFESVNYPNHFIYHDVIQLKIKKANASEAFWERASFKILPSSEIILIFGSNPDNVTEESTGKEFLR